MIARDDHATPNQEQDGHTDKFGLNLAAWTNSHRFSGAAQVAMLYWVRRRMVVADSLPIQRVIRRVRGEGIAVYGVSAGWSQIREVTHMTTDVSEGLWVSLLREEPALRSWLSEATPHNRAERGLTDDSTSEAISFPR